MKNDLSLLCIIIQTFHPTVGSCIRVFAFTACGSS